MKKILDALEALCRAVPGLSRLEVALTESDRPMFTLSVTTDDMVRETALLFGGSSNDIHYYKRDDREWISAYLPNPYIAIHGPHRPVVAVDPVDESKVAAALAQANEAVSK